jgi:ArsR family transcriptional regulator, zinc-responsive transcriptional repressor
MKITDKIPQDQLEQAADCFRVMAHPTRLRIVEILLSGEYCVREVAERCRTSEHQTCEHLRLLKGQGLLGCERRGRTVYYKVISPRLPKIIECIRSVCQELKAKGAKS